MLWGVKKISHFMRDFLLYPICGCYILFADAISYLRMLYSICGCYILFAVAMWDCDELIGGGEEEFEGF